VLSLPTFEVRASVSVKTSSACFVAAAMSAACAVTGEPPAGPGAAHLPARSANPPPARSAATTAPGASAAPSTAALDPLEAPSEFVELPLAKGRPAVVSLPLGSTSARPVLVATHGAGGSAMSHCKLWRGVVADRAFVLCPRGYPILPHVAPEDTGYFYNGHPALAEEIELALAALSREYGERVDGSAPIFAGYSQGANMGALVLPNHSARFARAVLWEGGVGEYQEWNIRVAERFREHGGVRVLLACGGPKCYGHAQTTARYLERGGLATHIVFVPGAGHTYQGELGAKVGEAFAWLVEGDSRW
jgi:predicted esterase